MARCIDHASPVLRRFGKRSAKPRWLFGVGGIGLHGGGQLFKEADCCWRVRDLLRAGRDFFGRRGDLLGGILDFPDDLVDLCPK